MLYEFLEEMYEKPDDGKAVDVTYFDFAEAFDKVPHIRLENKMKVSGFEGSLLRWIENWLNYRRPRVGIKGKFLEWIKVISGMPQGLVRGLLLSVIFIIVDGIVSIQNYAGVWLRRLL